MLSRRLPSAALLILTVNLAFSFSPSAIPESHFSQAHPAKEALMFPLLQEDDGGTVVLEFTFGDFSDEIGGVFHFNQPELPSGGELGPIISGHTVTDFSMQLVFNFDNLSVTGNLHADTTMDDSRDRPEESGSSTIDGQLSEGWLQWKPEDNVWVFGGTFNLSVSIQEVRSKHDREGVILYEDLNLQFDAPAEFVGASGDSDDPDIWPHIDIRYEKFDLDGFSLGSHNATSIRIGFYDNGVDFSGFPGQEGPAESVPEEEAPTEVAAEEELLSGRGLIDDDLLAEIVMFLEWGVGDLESIKAHDQWIFLDLYQKASLEELILEVEAIRIAQLPQDELEALFQYVEGQEDTMYELSDEGQAILNRKAFQKGLREKRERDLADRIEKEAYAWQRIEQVVLEERIRDLGGRRGDELLLIFKNESILSSINTKIEEWLGYIENPEEAAVNYSKDLIDKELDAKSMEDAALEAIKTISKVANVPQVIHYGYFIERREYWEGKGQSFEDAHDNALQDLQVMIEKPTEEYQDADGGRVARGVWDPRWSELAKEGGVYDRAFLRLYPIASHPGVSK